MIKMKIDIPCKYQDTFTKATTHQVQIYKEGTQPQSIEKCNQFPHL